MMMKNQELKLLLTRSAASDAPTALKPRDVLTLISGSGVNGTLEDAEEALKNAPLEIGYLLNRVRPASIVASCLSPVDLHQLGVKLEVIKLLGMDALSLTILGAEWVKAACELYGARSMKRALLVRAEDAVALAGDDAESVEIMAVMEVTHDDLLALCPGDVEHAAAVVAQLGAPGCLTTSVKLETLLQTGLTASNLRDLGVSFEFLTSVFKPTPSQLLALGYRA